MKVTVKIIKCFCMQSPPTKYFVITFMISSNEKDIDCLSNILLTTDLKYKQVNKGTFITIKIVIDFIGLISTSSGKRFRFRYI